MWRDQVWSTFSVYEDDMGEEKRNWVLMGLMMDPVFRRQSDKYRRKHRPARNTFESLMEYPYAILLKVTLPLQPVS